MQLKIGEQIKRVKDNRVIVFYLWTLFMGISIVVRCLPTMIYPVKALEYLVIMGLSGLTILLYIKEVEIRKFKLCEIFLLITPLFFFTGGGSMKYIFFLVVAMAFFVLVQREYSVISFLQYPIIIFALLTSVVTWISFFAPQFYMDKILTLFPEGSELIYSFLHKNMYQGFTNHYSRNSFYITIAIFLLFSHLITKQMQYKKTVIGMLLFFLCTQFLVAKRGPTLFMFAAMFLIIFLREKDLKKKVKACLIFGAAALVMFVAAYFLVPGVDNMVQRIFSPNEYGDISSGRFYLYGTAWEMFMEHPILGNGWGSFLNAMEGSTFQGVHNDYLQMMTENGIIGLLVYVAANFGCLYYAYKVFKIKRDEAFDGTKEKMWLYFSFMYQLFFLMYALTELPHYSYEQITLYVMMCGYSMALYKYGDKVKERHAD